MPKALDLLGQSFDEWLIMKKLPSQKGKTYWQCECKYCHKQKNIQTTHLTNHTYAHCDCLEGLQNNEQQAERICPLCGQTFKPIYKGYTRKFCFNCSPSYSKNDGRAQNLTAIRRALKRQLVKYKGGKCEICGYNKCISALQFHHINSQEKDFTISEQLNLSNFNIQKYYNEVDKCILVCANCHAEIHEKEQE